MKTMGNTIFEPVKELEKLFKIMQKNSAEELKRNPFASIAQVMEMTAFLENIYAKGYKDGSKISQVSKYIKNN